MTLSEIVSEMLSEQLLEILACSLEYRTMEIVHDTVAIPYDGDQYNIALVARYRSVYRWRSTRCLQRLSYTMEIVTMLALAVLAILYNED